MTDTPQGALPLPVVPGLTDLQVFARGGYATVYRATQQSVGREVAVKVENRTLDSERDQRRFLREARAAGRMSSHPHVVDLFDAGVTEDQHPYLIMELCDGSYAERMRTSPLDPIEARDVGVKIADALADAHQLGVLHRDVKPANILYSRFNEPALADFGLAVLAEARDTAITLEVLTPAYAPPEMFRHSPPSPAVDVYALCATLYAVMHGKPPRWQADRNPGLLTLLDLFAEPIPELPGVPTRLLDLLRYGMANDPADRPSAEQLRDLLAAVPLDPPTVAYTPNPTVIAAVPISGIPVSGGSWPGTPVGDPAGGGASAGGGAAANSGVVSTPAGLPSPRTPTSGAPVSGVPVSGVPVSPVSGVPVSGAQPPGAPPPTVYLSKSYTPPPPRPASDDPEPTVPHPGRRRRRYWIFGGLGALVLVAVIVGGSWYFATRGRPQSPPSGERGGPTSTRSLSGGTLPGCGVSLPLPPGARCPAELKCFGPVPNVYTGADGLSCAGRHTWESYAEGDLPIGVDPADQKAVLANPVVRGICNATVFRLTTTLIEIDGWRFEVLPPTAGATGRTFRCLAGRGVDQLVGPTLTAI